MNHIRRAAFFNNQGTIHLGTGETGKAFKSFKASLQSLAKAIVKADESSQMEDDATAGNSSEEISRATPRSIMNQKQDEEGQPYLYSKGLVFYPSSTLTLVDLSFYCSVVVFNLVITFHSRGKNFQERDLHKLLQMYDLCLKLISESSRSSQYDCGNLMVAALNNKSVVHSELEQHTTARRMLYHVWDVMQYPERRPRHMERWEIEGIFLNIYLVLVNGPQVAGAA